MAIKLITTPTDYTQTIQSINTVLNLPATYFDDVTGVLGLVTKPNTANGSRPFQQNAEDIKDFFPVVKRSDYFRKWQYNLPAISGNGAGNIILYPYLQNDYEYLQIKFDGGPQDLKTSLQAEDRLVFIKKKNSVTYELFRIPLASNPLGTTKEFLAINTALCQTDETFFNSPPIEIGINDNKYPLNQILYGPPGTGKTHNAINHALAIITGQDLKELIEAEKTNPANRKKAKDDFDKLIINGQIQFVTFHQSYSYEEFIEGIKPTVNIKGEVEYNINDGVFKQLCIEAGKKESYDFEEIFDLFSTQVKVATSLPLKTSVWKKDFTVVVDDKGTIFAKTANSGTEIKKEAVKNYLEKGIIPAWWGSYIRAVGDYLKTTYTDQIENVDNTQKNYVLIIDEINRGNISKIFGEIITLIEDSKRIGANEELQIKLTYTGANSDEKFGIPQNVYIIGTMNSADRSIALIDTALRRRFTFFEYTSDSELLSDNIEGIDLQNLVSTINKRIEFLLDKDHLIGHAYFINVKTKDELCATFRNKVIPLLEEYFYGDYEKIQLVLGDNKEFGKTSTNRIIIAKQSSEQKRIFGKEIEGFEEKVLYGINDKILNENYSEIGVDFFTSIYTKPPTPTTA